MKKELIKIIKIVGINFNEIFIEINIGNGVTYNSIEYIEPNGIRLHIITDDMDIETHWEDLSIPQRREVLKVVRPLLYN